MRYRDSSTGRFVSASTYHRSRSHGGTRYKKIRSVPSPAPKKKTEIIMHMVHGRVNTRERRGGPVRSFARDILIPAPRGTSQKELMQIAQETVIEKMDNATRAIIFNPKAAKITVTEGPKTRARRAQLR